MNKKFLLLSLIFFTASPACFAEPSASAAQNEDSSAQKGIELIKAGDWAQAKLFFEAYTAAHPGDFAAQEMLARALLNLGELDPALARAKKAVELNAGSAEAYATLLGIHQKKGNWIEGLNARDQALKLNPKLGRIYYYAGKLYLEQMLIDEAAASFEKAMDLDADFPNIQADLGAAYFEQGLYDRALKQYQRALKKDPDNAGAQRGIASVYDKQGKEKLAVEAYQKSVVMNPKDAESYFHLGDLYERSKKKKEAIAAYYESVKADPDYLTAYKKLGPLATEAKDWDKAVYAYEKMTELQPDIMDLSHLAFLYQMKGDSEKAISAYQKTIELDPADTVAYYNLAVIYQKAEKLDEAIKNYVKARELDPEDGAFAVGLATVYCKKKEAFLAWSTFESSAAIKDNKSLKNYLTSACPRNILNPSPVGKDTGLSKKA